MKYTRIPTNLILERPCMKHLFGKWWWDKKYHHLVKGDKKNLKKVLTNSQKYAIINTERNERGN